MVRVFCMACYGTGMLVNLSLSSVVNIDRSLPPVEKGNYKDSKQDGLWESYDENGDLLHKEYYKNGELHGPREFFNKKGQLYHRENFKNGKQHGSEERFHENGQLEAKANFKNGKQHGGPSDLSLIHI